MNIRLIKLQSKHELMFKGLYNDYKDNGGFTQPESVFDPYTDFTHHLSKCDSVSSLDITFAQSCNTTALFGVVAIDKYVNDVIVSIRPTHLNFYLCRDLLVLVFNELRSQGRFDIMLTVSDSFVKHSDLLTTDGVCVYEHLTNCYRLCVDLNVNRIGATDA